MINCKHVIRCISLILITNLVVFPVFSEQDDLWFFVLVKSNNHSQNQDGELKLLNYHFFSELFPKKAGKIKSARLSRLGKDEAQFEFEDRGDSYYFEGGHFNTEQAVDESHPNGEYEFDIEFHSGRKVSSIMSLSGPEGTTDIPAPIRIFFHQQGKTVAQNAINPSLPLEVSWSLYSNGRFDPNGVVDDMIFVVFQSCQGERVFHTGLPFKEKEYTKFTTKKMTVPAGRFKPGQTYSMFVEFPHVVDSTIDDDVPGFTSYATATYTDINTTGDIEAGSCPEDIPPLDTGQTDRMDVEINE